MAGQPRYQQQESTLPASPSPRLLVAQGGTRQPLEVPTTALHFKECSAPPLNCCQLPKGQRDVSITCCLVLWTQGSTY